MSLVVFSDKIQDDRARLPDGKVIVGVVDEGWHTAVGVELCVWCLLVLAFFFRRKTWLVSPCAICKLWEKHTSGHLHVDGIVFKSQLLQNHHHLPWVRA